MGQDKALLPHPEGGTWLERQLRLLASLGEPVTLLTRHASHLELADRLADQGVPVRHPIQEGQQQRGPLLALQSLLEGYPDALILLCPVDMPWLQQDALARLRMAWAQADGMEAIAVAHDGDRAQPLLGLYPATVERRIRLRCFTQAGGRGCSVGWSGSRCTWWPCLPISSGIATIARIAWPL
jgi:molybdopterin-guanine dinucleotide biosynthesis protein A